MSKVQTVRALVEQRLTAAAEEIFGLFERTIAEYEEELCRSKEENERQQKLLDAVFNPQLQLHRADVQQLLEVKEEYPPEQQDSSLHQDQDQEDPEPRHIEEEQERDPPHRRTPTDGGSLSQHTAVQTVPQTHIKEDQDQEEPEPPHIKEEQEELWSSQEGEQQLQGLEEADITKSTFTPVPVKSEDDEEKPQSSQLHHTQTEHMETEAAGEDCGGPGPHRDSGPDLYLQPGSEDDSETASSEPGLRRDGVSVSDKRRRAVKKPPSCSECRKTFHSKSNLNIHMRIHTGEKPFSCSFCERRFTQKQHLMCHLKCHKAKSALSCPVPDRRFKNSRAGSRRRTEQDGVGGRTSEFSAAPSEAESSSNSRKNNRVRTSASEKPFGCSECREIFSSSTLLKVHMRVHTGEKPFSCSVCGNRFSQRGNLLRHMSSHTGVKPYSCPVCTESFKSRRHLRIHKRHHTSEELTASSVSDRKKTKAQKHQQDI